MWVYFDAHRVFDPKTILSIFSDLSLLEFSLVDDDGTAVTRNASLESAQKCEFGCGLFVFKK